MNKRLNTIISFIEEGTGIIDVGTDHGFLPIALAQKGYTGNIFASDINSEPLQTAKNNAYDAGVEDKIQFLLCDGLTKCPPDMVDTIVIAGMGGDMICSILDFAEWIMDANYKLILQPMTKQEVVRYWLSNNGFKTEKEELIIDGNTIYQIIVSRFDGYTKYNDAELFTGKYELTNDKKTYVYQLERITERFKNTIDGLCSGEQPDYSKISLYNKMLIELEEMRKLYASCK